MNQFGKDLQRIQDELATAQADHARLAARIQGLQAERDALLRMAASEPTAAAEPRLKETTKDRAIVAVLRRSAGPMRIGEIVHALEQAGREENYNGISVYLDMLLKTGRVTRVGRGLYRAADAGASG